MPTTTFTPLGPAPIQDPFVARLNRANPWGSGKATGAINSLELIQNEVTKDAVLFAGAVNGGIWSRQYNGAKDAWKEWKQVSSYNDYKGIQSISELKATEDGRFLIAAAGDRSSWQNLRGDIQDPLQIAVLGPDGSVEAWLSNDPSAQKVLSGQAVTALEETENVVLIGTPKGLYVGEIDGELKPILAVNANAAIRQAASSIQLPEFKNYTITSLAKGDSGRIYAAVNAETREGNIGGVITTTIDKLKKNPTAEWEIIEGSIERSVMKSTLKLSTSKDPATGRDILYLGTASIYSEAYDYIYQLRFDDKGKSQAWIRAEVKDRIGDGQATLHASFASHPINSNTVFAGGNIMGHPNPAYPGTYNGGLVEVLFHGTDVTLAEHFASLGRPKNAGGTAPHADSRDIIFLKTKSGSIRIIEASDGGIAIKDLNLDAQWQFDLNEGLRTTESFSSDWSNVGNLAITAMQDNALSIARHKSMPIWLNVTGGDGAHARFDDAPKGTNQGLAYAYYGYQKYSGNGIVESAAYDESGILRNTERLELEVRDRFGNFQDFLNYDMEYTGAADYPFYLPFETNAYRAGDVVLAGQRNLYEQIVPHWELRTSGEMWLAPLLEDLDDRKNIRRFTAVEVGSRKGESFTKSKPDSWDALYTSFRQKNRNGDLVTHFYGRKAGEATEDLNKAMDGLDRLKLKDLSGFLPDVAKNQVITGITINPNNSDQIWATVSKDHVMYGRSHKNFSEPSYLIHSKNGGIDWEICVKSGYSGIPSNAQLQQVQYTPSTEGRPAELFISGYGGIWHSPVDDNGNLSAFQSVMWDGRDMKPIPFNQAILDVNQNSDFNYWTTNLEYDPVDDTVIASTMGQGAWILNRSELVEAPAAEPGLRINPIWLPQDNQFLRRKKVRTIEGVMTVSLERTDENMGQDVSVELVLPDGWEKYLDFSADDPQFSGLVGGNRIRLDFPSGVNQLSFYVNTKLGGATLPDIILELKLENPVNSVVASDSSSAVIYLFANGETSVMRQEAPGVFYSETTPIERDQELSRQAQNLAVLMPRSGLNQGDQLFWIPVNSDGSIDLPDRRVLPTSEDYIFAVNELITSGTFSGLSQLIATATETHDSRAFSPERMALAFSNPSAVIVSEGISIGELSTTQGTSLAAADRFALALRDGNGNIRVSTQGFEIDPNPIVDNTLTIGRTSGIGSQVVLAPAEGELFVADINFLPTNSAEPASITEYSLEVAHFSSFDSGYGIFRVDDPLGNFRFIDGSLLEEPMEPGTLAYAKEALRRSASNGVDGITGLPIPGYAQSIKETISLATGNYYGIYITPNNIFSSADQLRDMSEILFSIKNANQDQLLQHVSMGTGLFAFDDRGLAGDRDFNDMIFAIKPLNN